MLTMLRGSRLAITAAAAIALILGSATTASAETVAEPDRLYLADIYTNQNPSQNVLGGLIFDFSQAGATPEANITVHVTTFSCGNVLKETTKTLDGANGFVPINFSPDGGLDSSANAVNRRVGPSVQYKVDFVHPGFDAYHVESSYSGYSVQRPSCAEINGTASPISCVVKAQPRKVGVARVGRTVAATPPKTNGHCGRWSYAWKVNGKMVKRGQAMYVGKGMRGKRVSVTVALSSGPDKILGFGRAK